MEDSRDPSSPCTVVAVDELQAVIAQLLEQYKRRPRMREVARAIGVTEWRLRRQFHAGRVNGLAPCSPVRFRSILTCECARYGKHLIELGYKIEAAVKLAGFNNRTNFNRQFKALFGCLPSQCRNRRTS